MVVAFMGDGGLERVRLCLYSGRFCENPLYLFLFLVRFLWRALPSLFIISILVLVLVPALSIESGPGSVDGIWNLDRESNIDRGDEKYYL